MVGVYRLLRSKMNDIKAVVLLGKLINKHYEVIFLDPHMFKENSQLVDEVYQEIDRLLPRLRSMRTA